MKIEDNRAKYHMEFRYLAIGQCFEYDDNFYIKCGFRTNSMNAVRLSTGELISISGEEKIVPLKARLVIEGVM